MDDQATGSASERPWWRTAPGVHLLILLLVTDVLFVLGWVVLELGLLTDDRLAVDADRGMPETWGYIKLLWAILACMVLAWRHRERVFAAIGVLLSWLLLDDGMQVTAEVGAWLDDAGAVSGAAGLTGTEVGAMVVMAVVAVPLLATIALLYRSTPPWPTRVARGMLLCIAALAVAGVGADLLVSVVGVLEPLFTLLEEGGELAAESALAAFALTVALLDDHASLRWWSAAGEDPAWHDRRAPTDDLTVARRG